MLPVLLAEGRVIVVALRRREVWHDYWVRERVEACQHCSAALSVLVGHRRLPMNAAGEPGHRRTYRAG